mmetsp:Transcript_1394/g.2408  ORF Transcript_1394/g.2408 Transcript_1394/m.2408 type:complete len:273 (-) Transcript_1394:327-1145(-)
MAAATLPTPLHDPFSGHHTHYSPSETIPSLLLDLLATDHLVDSHAAPPATTNLLNDLLAVDLEFDRVNVRDHYNVATAPSLKEEKDVFMDLLSTDQEVDNAAKKQKGENVPQQHQQQHYATSKALCDPYVKKECRVVDLFAGQVYGGVAQATSSTSKKVGNEEQQQLRDNLVMMHLLAVDESIDDSKRLNKLMSSDDFAIIGELYDVDREVSGAKQRVLLVEDLQSLLDVDHLVDGVKKTDVTSASAGSEGGKRSIFSVKEKYSAKVANRYA